jgi:hypothetical protein
MKALDVKKTVDLAEHFLRSSAARALPPIEMADRWAAIHRLRASLAQETQTLAPITTAVPKPGVHPDRHERNPS